MTREDKLVERITYITKIALGEEPNKDFSEAILPSSASTTHNRPPMAGCYSKPTRAGTR